MPHIRIKPKKMLGYRKLVFASWRENYDPTATGFMPVRMDRALEYVRDFREQKGRRLTVTTLMIRAVAQALREVPEANTMLRLGRLYQREQVNVSVIVTDREDGATKGNIISARIEDADRKSLVALLDDLEAAIRAQKERKGPAPEEILGRLPLPLLRPAVRALSFVRYSLNLDLSRFGFARDPYGSVEVTNIGSLGLENASIPLLPYIHMPLVIGPGLIQEQPIVVDGKIVVGKMMNVNAAFDHRYMDGMHMSQVFQVIRRMLENPYEHFDRLESADFLTPLRREAARSASEIPAAQS